MSTKVCTAIVAISLWLAACSSPESALERAERSMDATDIQYVIDRYPDSPEAQTAATYLEELAAWRAAVNATTSAPYAEFLDTWPHGLFEADARSRLNEIVVWQSVRRNATAEAIEDYLDEYPDGLFAAEAKSRLAELETFAERFAAVPADASVETLRTAAQDMAGSGYARKLWLRVETAAAASAEAELAADEAFAALDAAAWQDLDRFISKSGHDDSALARQAREQLEIAKVEATNGGARFTLPGIAVHGLSDPTQFSISDKPASEEGTMTLNFGGAMSNGPPDEEICFMAEGDVESAIAFTEFEDDRIPLYMDSMMPFTFASGNRGFIKGTGGYVLGRLEPIHCSAGSVWRVYGDVGIVPGHRIKGDAEQGLAFYLVENVGAVYLAGLGEVITASGERIFAAGTEDDQ